MFRLPTGFFIVLNFGAIGESATLDMPVIQRVIDASATPEILTH
jgi:hypothetical protein